VLDANTAAANNGRVGSADPPIRIVEVARGFGAHGIVQSICEKDYGRAIDQIVGTIYGLRARVASQDAGASSPAPTTQAPTMHPPPDSGTPAADGGACVIGRFCAAPNTGCASLTLVHTGTSTSCSFDLMPPTSTPEKLELVVEVATMPGVERLVPHDLGSAGGWTINADGSHVDFSGALCTAAKSGKFSKVDFEFGCTNLATISAADLM
jgi:hypothetical protein